MLCVCKSNVIYQFRSKKNRELINELNFYGLETFVWCQCMCVGVYDVVCVGVCEQHAIEN